MSQDTSELCCLRWYCRTALSMKGELVAPKGFKGVHTKLAGRVCRISQPEEASEVPVIWIQAKMQEPLLNVCRDPKAVRSKADKNSIKVINTGQSQSLRLG